MRRFSLLAVLAALMIFSLTLAGDDPAWFSMEDCSFCSHLLADPGLMENMTWEHYDISNGALALTIVAPEYEKSYLKAMQGMQMTSEEMGKGKTDMHMCGHCQMFGKLKAAGASFEYVNTSSGDIVLITSDKPEIIKMIHDYAQRNRDELAKLSIEEMK